MNLPDDVGSLSLRASAGTGQQRHSQLYLAVDALERRGGLGTVRRTSILIVFGRDVIVGCDPVELEEIVPQCLPTRFAEAQESQK